MMKKILGLALSLVLNQAFALPHLELVSHYDFDFVNWSLVTQLMPLQDGGYIVQKYGQIISQFDAQGTLVRELEIGLVYPLYQKGTQLKDGRIVFINTNATVTFFDPQLNKLADYKLPVTYSFAPCLLDNGKLVFGTYNENKIVMMDTTGSFSTANVLGKDLRETQCLSDNRVAVMSDGGLLNVFDLSSREVKNLFQKQYQFVQNSLKIINGTAKFLTTEGLTILNLNNWQETSWPNPNLKEFAGVDYFHDGRYVVVNSVPGKAYDTEVTLFSKTGEKLGNVIEKKTGASIDSPVKIINDQQIVTNHCANHIVLYDDQLNELNRYPTEEWLCNDPIVLASGHEFIMAGYRDGFHRVYQMKITE